MDTEQRLIRGLLGSPDLAVDVSAMVDPSHFSDPESLTVFDAICDCVRDGERPDAHRVGRLVRARVPDFAVDFGQAGLLLTRTEVHELAGTVKLRGTKREIARSLSQLSTLVASVVENDQMGTDQVQAQIASAIVSAVSRTSAPLRTLAEISAEVLEDMQARHDGRLDELVWRTGVREVDARIFCSPGTVTGLAADSSHGKTSFASWFVEMILRAYIGLGAVHVSLADSSLKGMTARRMAAESEVNSNAISFFRSTAEELEWTRAGTKRMNSSYGRRYIPVTSGKSWSEIEATIRRACLRFRNEGIRPGIAVIDYLQVVKVDGCKDPFSAMTEAVERAEALSKELDIHIVVLSQLNAQASNVKPGEKRPPRVADIWGGKQLEWYCTSLVLLRRCGRVQPAPRMCHNGLKTGQPVPPILRSVFDAELYGLKGRNQSEPYPGKLHYVGALCRYEDGEHGVITKWNAQNLPATTRSTTSPTTNAAPSQWGTP